MTVENKRIIELHYELFVASRHSMDALSYNRAEYNLILAIRYLKKYVGSGFIVNVEAKREGSIIDTIQVIVDDPSVKHIFDVLLGAFIAHWFRPKIHKTEEIKNRLEIIEKIKSGNLSKDEAELIISGDKTLIKWCSNYYKSIQDSQEVSQITASFISNTKTIDQATIAHNNFDEKIITSEERTETKTIEGATIHIVSPILARVSRKILWKGVYSGESIDFKVDDPEFLAQVYNHEIKFGNGTYITCALTITTLTKTNDDGEIKVEHSYIVKNVSQWADDETFKYYTKRYKRIQKEKNTPQTPSIFSEEELSNLSLT